MLLTEPGTKIEGPEPEVLRVVFSILTLSLHAELDLTERQAEALAMRILVRCQQRLALAGYITRDTAADD